MSSFAVPMMQPISSVIAPTLTTIVCSVAFAVKIGCDRAIR